MPSFKKLIQAAFGNPPVPDKSANLLFRSEETKVEIWNRPVEDVRARLFTDTASDNGKYAYKLIPAGREFISLFNESDDVVNRPGPEDVETELPIGTEEEMFADDKVCLDMGCGGGSAAAGFAKDHPRAHIIGGDIAIPTEVNPQVPEGVSNLEYVHLDWGNMDQYPDDAFDSIYSDQGVARYGNNDKVVAELTRVSKVGTILRATQDDQTVAWKSDFSDKLAEHGWDVYRHPGNKKLIIAVLREKLTPQR